MKLTYIFSLLVAVTSIEALSIQQRAFQHAPEGFLPGVSQAVKQLTSEQTHTTAGDVYGVFDSLDHVADFLVYTAGSSLSPVTLGMSNQVANVLSGKYVQSLTHGTFALLSHVAGDIPDAVTGRKAEYQARLAKTQAKLAKASKKLKAAGVNTTNLDNARNKLSQKVSN